MRLMFSFMVAFISFLTIVFAADYYCPTGATSGCIDCIEKPCNECSVTDMYVKIYNPAGQLVGEDVPLTFDSQSGSCTSTSQIFEVWTKSLPLSYFGTSGTYTVIAYAQIANGDWEYSNNITIDVGLDCTGTSASRCNVCDVTDMYVKIYNPAGQLVGNESLTFDSQSGSCGPTSQIKQTWKKHLGPTYFKESGTYTVTSYAQIANGDWEYSNNITIDVGVVEIDYSFEIHPGWNLISIPSGGIINIDDTCNVFSRSFSYWNATTKEWEFYSWSQITFGRAYWLRSESENVCTVNVDGYGDITVNDIPPLKAGYNFVGALSSNKDISSIKGSCVLTQDPLYWDVSIQDWKKTTTIEPAKGYWIHVSNDCQFS